MEELGRLLYALACGSVIFCALYYGAKLGAIRKTEVSRV